MRKLWLLAKSNIRKGKAASVSLLFIIMVAAFLFNLGIVTLRNFDRAIDEKSEKLNSAHMSAAMYELYYDDSYEKYFKDYPGVTQTEKEEILYLWMAQFKYSSGELINSCIFLNADNKSKISRLSFVGEQKPTGNRDIYVSYILHTGGGYQLGDEFVIHYQGRDYIFQIAGFTEDIHLGSINLGCIGFHLPQETYRWFEKELMEEGCAGIILKARLSDDTLSANMAADFNKNMMASSQSGQASSLWLSSYTVAKNTRTTTAEISGIIIIAFSIIVVLVSLFIMKYRISSGIEDGITQLGTLMALGYTYQQIRISILFQYLFLTFFGGIIGIALSFPAIGILSGMFSAQTGIIWQQGFDCNSALITLGSITTTVMIMIPIAAIRLKKLLPVNAFRTGLQFSHNKKNYFPLVKMRGGLDYVLAMKNMVFHLKQNIRISGIVAAISFTCVFAVIVYYNIAANNKAFIDMIGSEVCSLTVVVYPGVDSVALGDEISKMEGVIKAIHYDYFSVTVNHEGCQLMVSDDFLQLDTNSIYLGRYPQSSKEAVISGYVAKRFNKNVGDRITVQMGDTKAEYTISGLIQNISNIGMNIAVTFDGMKRIIPTYAYHNINIYLEGGKEVSVFQNELIEEYGFRINEIMDMKEMSKSQLSIYVFIVTIFAVVILFITGLFIYITLYLIIKAKIQRQKKEFGIQKAIGYTTIQLMFQTSLSFLPIVLIGSIIGSILGSVYINPMISILFRQIGIMKTAFIIPPLWIGIVCIGICLLSFAVSMFVSWRIRKISVYTLIGE
jgi:putative ABC transport system permease protein